MDLVIAAIDAVAGIVTLVVAIVVILIVGNAIRNAKNTFRGRRGASSAGATSGSGWAANPILLISST